MRGEFVAPERTQQVRRRSRSRPALPLFIRQTRVESPIASANEDALVVAVVGGLADPIEEVDAEVVFAPRRDSPPARRRACGSRRPPQPVGAAGPGVLDIARRTVGVTSALLSMISAQRVSPSFAPAP